MLLEAKRLASLQKRRELKAAGLELKMREKKRKYIDYGREIPFHRQAPAGYYPTGEEKAEGLKQQLDPRFEALRVDKLEAERRDEEEARQRAQDRKRHKKLVEENLPQLVMAVNNANDPVAIRRRVPLSLPAPQVSDQELEEIVKLGQAGALAGAGGGGDGATAALLGDYRDAPTPLATPMRTPRAAAGQDVVMQEARNLLALQRAETPLKGGEAVVPGLEEGTGFEGHVPRSGRITTPSAFAAASSQRGGPGGMTPMAGGATPLDRRSAGGSSVAGGRAGLPGGATPMRDQLGLNQGAMGGLDPAQQQLMLLSEKKRQRALRAQLAEGLSALPEPQFAYEISVPELDEEDAAAEAAAAIPEDAADRDAREAAKRRAQEEAELERRSTVLKRGLPRPATVDPEAFTLPKGADVGGDPVVAADQAVLQELLGVLRHDNAKYPVGGGGAAGGGKKGKKAKGGGGAGGAVPHLATIHPKLLAKARAMVEEEAARAGEAPPADAGEMEEAWLKAYGDLAYFPNRQAFGRLSGAAKPDRLAALIFQFDALSSALERDAKKVRGRRREMEGGGIIFKEGRE